ncbi:cryptochrome/photolyase family protein [Bradyrhizobium amphicarpaeae]|uniref:cryptochrome/photolyase family protein n=1 Tax=Bradyrhizobium amphicarpaeae TaxID=1404768 RepID=UPI001FCE7132|nr:cryptochrome/photolyase family protein [Bradyrhizobium amphicarpaeae]
MERSHTPKTVRHLVLVLGDQLDADSAAFDDFDPASDVVLQMEVMEETSYIAQHKKRIAYFLASMRHFRDELIARGRRVHYVEIDDPANTGRFETEIGRAQRRFKPSRTIALEPGDWRVAEKLRRLPEPPEIRPDRHFLCSREEFANFCEKHPRPILETFYRAMRRKTGLLMDRENQPVGGAWNFDAENRKALGRNSPAIPTRPSCPPDEITADVLRLVAKRFADSPGKIEGFDLPVTRGEALAQLDAFVTERLPLFGTYQDAMRSGEPFLFHSVLSGPLNLHRLQPREVVEAALRNKGAPLNALEGFTRQIIGWREFVRGIYWQRMPHYADENALDADLPMPRFYWSGNTDMRCLAEAIGHTIDHAYAHHIERLMVLGLFAMLLGVRPYEVHRWHMSMFWDAVDWVSLPNTLGMSQHGDGGIVGTKPYAASGNYINRMSDHCRHCRFDPRQSVGEDACPFTTLYWNFLDKHRRRFASNVRMRNQYSNLDRKDGAELRAIRRQAAAISQRVT